MTKSPWVEAGISRTTWYRRHKLMDLVDSLHDQVERLQAQIIMKDGVIVQLTTQKHLLEAELIEFKTKLSTVRWQ